MDKTDSSKPAMMDEHESRKTSLAQFVKEKFQENTVLLKELPSFQDINILIQSTDTHTSSSSPTSRKFVLKIISCHESSESESLLRQIQCVNCLKSKQFLCSEFISDVDGNYIQTLDIDRSGPYRNKSALLYSFLDGIELEHTGYVQYPFVIFELGSFLAHFHNALKDTPLPLKEYLVPDLEDPWHLNNYKLLLTDSYMNVIKDDSKRQMLSSVLEYAVKTVDASKHSLTKDLLHGDFHGLNIIVPGSYKPSDRSSHRPIISGRNNNETEHSGNQILETDSHKSCAAQTDFDSLISFVEMIKSTKHNYSSSSDLLDVYGIIDFREISYSYTVLEVGRLIADVMATYLVDNYSKPKAKCTTAGSLSNLVGESRGNDDVIVDLSESSRDYLFNIGGYVMAGYLLENPLPLTDLNCIYSAVLISLCQYYILGNKAALDQPESEDYVAYCSREAFILLELFNGMDVQSVLQLWHNAAEEVLHIN